MLTNYHWTICWISFKPFVKIIATIQWLYHFHMLMVCISSSEFDTQAQYFEYVIFSKRNQLLTKRQRCRITTYLFSNHHFASLTVAIMTCFQLQVSTGPDAELFVSHPLLDCCFYTGLNDGNPVCLHAGVTGSRECLLLSGTLSYICICLGSLLPHTRFYICALDYDYVWHIVNLAILYSIPLVRLSFPYWFWPQ
jgi:hypothetical protein